MWEGAVLPEQAYGGKEYRKKEDQKVSLAGELTASGVGMSLDKSREETGQSLQAFPGLVQDCYLISEQRGITEDFKEDSIQQDLTCILQRYDCSVGNG